MMLVVIQEIIPPPAPAVSPDVSLLARLPVVNQEVTVEQAVAIALRENPMVRGAEAEADLAAGRRKRAQAETRPMLSANLFASGGSNPAIISAPATAPPSMVMSLPRDRFIVQNLMLMYPVYTSGRLTALNRQAGAQENAARASVATQRQDIALLTRTAYREVQARQAMVTVARARLTQNEERLRTDRERLAVERIPAYYVRRDEAEVAAARQEVTNAERDVKTAVSQLKTLMGISPASQLTLAEKLTYEPTVPLFARLLGMEVAASEPSSELVGLLARAAKQRPELQSAAYQVQAAQAGERTARAAYRPQANLFAMGDVAKSRMDSAMGGITYGLVLSVPLLTGGADRADAEMAAAERRQQEAQQQRIALQVAREVNDTYVTLKAAEQNVATAQAALTAAQAEYEAMQLRYEAGRSILSELLDAQTSRFRAESDVIQALFQCNVARDQLLRAVGT